MQENILRRGLLRRFRKTVSVGADVTSDGRLFQRRHPATGNARSPTLLNQPIRAKLIVKIRSSTTYIMHYVIACACVFLQKEWSWSSLHCYCYVQFLRRSLERGHWQGCTDSDSCNIVQRRSQPINEAEGSSFRPYILSEKSSILVQSWLGKWAGNAWAFDDRLTNIIDLVYVKLWKTLPESKLVVFRGTANLNRKLSYRSSSSSIRLHYLHMLTRKNPLLKNIVNTDASHKSYKSIIL